MTIEQAWKIVGNTNRRHIANMVKALEMHPWCNTPKDNERLAAAKICLRHANPRYATTEGRKTK